MYVSVEPEKAAPHAGLREPKQALVALLRVKQPVPPIHVSYDHRDAEATEEYPVMVETEAPGYQV